LSKFTSLGISSEMENVLAKLGITVPTPIQTKVIPALLKEKDVMAKAQTGSGKTHAFALPMVDRSDETSSAIQGIIVTPTRELSIQIAGVLKQLTKKKKHSGVLAMYGGQSHEEEIKELEKKISFVVGTPGRILDQIKRGNLDLSSVKFFVLDEADEMLQIGFLNKVEEIIRATPSNRQMMLFSATLPAPIKKLAHKYMSKPLTIEIDEDAAPSSINQFAIFTIEKAKQETIVQLVEAFNPEKALIFCRTKRRVSKLYQVLRSKGIVAGELHGDIPQEKREEVMEAFRKREIPLLIATDVASRGLDIEGVTHVFNYDIPENTETYTHRIGRTGRAGAEGVSYTLYTAEDRPVLDKIEGDLQTRIQKQNLGNTISLKDKGKTASKKKKNKNKRKGSSPVHKSSNSKREEEQLEKSEGFYIKRPGKKSKPQNSKGTGESSSKIEKKLKTDGGKPANPRNKTTYRSNKHNK
jgi:ATP-dependent RNA helicase DeaD